MASITFSEFDSGLDVRKGSSLSGANQLRVLDNAYVTTGKTLRKRPGLKHEATLENGTVGLKAAKGKLNTFYAIGSITHADTRFEAHKAAYPTDATMQATKCHYADVFNGYIYASVGYGNGDSKHHYFDGTVPPVVVDANCPHTPQVAKQVSKIFSAKDDVVRFSKTVDPRDWTAASDAGLLGVGIQQIGAANPTGIGRYASFLVVFFSDSSQLWTVDPNPANMKYERSMDIGSPYAYASAGMAGDLFFVSSSGVRSITQIATTGNLVDVDVGSPIDKLLVPDLAAATDVRAFYYKGGGQFWVMLGNKAYVYSFSRTSKVSAWSKYTFPFTMDDYTELDGVLYFRSGNEVYSFKQGQYTDNGSAINVLCEFPFLDFKAPGILKQIRGMDAVVSGSASIAHRFDATEEDFITPPIVFSGDGRPGPMNPVEICTVGLAPVITHSGNEEFELHALTYYFDALGQI